MVQGNMESNITLFDYICFIPIVYYVFRCLRVTYKSSCKAYYGNWVAVVEVVANPDCLLNGTKKSGSLGEVHRDHYSEWKKDRCSGANE